MLQQVPQDAGQLMGGDTRNHHRHRQDSQASKQASEQQEFSQFQDGALRLLQGDLHPHYTSAICPLKRDGDVEHIGFNGGAEASGHANPLRHGGHHLNPAAMIFDPAHLIFIQIRISQYPSIAGNDGYTLTNGLAEPVRKWLHNGNRIGPIGH